MRLLKLVPDDTNIDFLKWRKLASAMSFILVAISLALVAYKGLNLGVDFVGGQSVRVEFPGAMPPIDEIREKVSHIGLGEPTIQQFGSDKAVSIRTALPEGDKAVADRAGKQLVEGIKKAFPAAKTGAVETVSGKVSGELIQNGVLAVMLAVIGIAIFSWFRYEWQFGVSTFVAIMHDVLMTLGFFAITQLEFDLNIVAAVLTIVGYSINDKMVIDDRIRENMRKYRKMDMRALIDLSVNETLPRTVMTSVTVLLALGALLLLGGHVLRGFTAAMMLGIIVGTYSSVYVSSSLLITLGLSPASAEKKAAKANIAAQAERMGPRDDGARP
jgi:preprotein translocase subunit SecF